MFPIHCSQISSVTNKISVPRNSYKSQQLQTVFSYVFYICRQIKTSKEKIYVCIYVYNEKKNVTSKHRSFILKTAIHGENVDPLNYNPQSMPAAKKW